MPQLWERRDEGMVRGGRVIEQRPDCAVGVAVVCAQWALLEGRLATLFEYTTTEWQESVVDDVSRYTVIGREYAAKLAFHAVDGLHSKLAMIEAALGARISNEIIEKFRSRIAPAIRKRSRERGKVAHALWYITNAAPESVFTRREDGIEGYVAENTFDRYTATDLREIGDRIYQTAELVSSFMVECTMHIAAQYATREKDAAI